MAERRGGLHIETLRLRVPARDAPSGKRAALELVQGLAARSPELLAAAPRGVAVGVLRVRVPAERARGATNGGVTNSVASALGRAVARASRGSGRS
ncbi:MAG TPA: hypothetical protein VMS65_11750 [Polyangiaceae bacterium]|nr:hypothetical protein [Polyangiaceae bacterium]